MLVPGLLNLTSTPYWFDLTSTPQQHLGNRTFQVPAVAVVGGGTVINGLFFDRGAAADYDAWAGLGNPGWAWDDLYPYFKKARSEARIAHEEEMMLTRSRVRTSLNPPRTTPTNLTSHGMTKAMATMGRSSRAIHPSNFLPSVSLNCRAWDKSSTLILRRTVFPSLAQLKRHHSPRPCCWYQSWCLLGSKLTRP